MTHHERIPQTHLDGAELSSGLQSKNTEGGRDDHLLLAVIGRGHTLEELESLESGGSTGGLQIPNQHFVSYLRLPHHCRLLTHLVGNHTTDGLVEDSGRSTVMERTGLLGVDQMPLVEELVVSELLNERRM